MADFDRESMLEMFVFEMTQLLSNLESTVLDAESGFTINDINEIFRIMHTIKGSAAMMLYDSVSSVAHKIEDLFFYLREEQPEEYDSGKVADVVLLGMDFIKHELEKIENGEEADGDNSTIIPNIISVLDEIKGMYNANDDVATSSVVEITGDKLEIVSPLKNKSTFLAKFNFEPDAVMKNVRAYTIFTNIERVYENAEHTPKELLEDSAIEYIENHSFFVKFVTDFDFESVCRTLAQNTNLFTMDISYAKEGNESLVLNSELEYICDVKLKDGYGESFKSIINIVNALDEVCDMITVCDIILLRSEMPEEAISFRVRSSRNIGVIKTAVEVLEDAELVDIMEVVGSATAPVVTVKETTAEPKKVEDLGLIPQPTVIEEKVYEVPETKMKESPKDEKVKKATGSQVISVNVSKLDELLNLMGELVITEAMVTQNSDLEGLELDNFNKDARQLHKIINDVQDIVMSMRMVPLSNVFFKMHRIVRDMSKSLNKDVELEIKGEETEVDKNIIEQISDPIMHMIRNSVDHGLESDEERDRIGKIEKSTVTLEAKNAGGDVLIIIRDNGRGINREKVLEKAKKNGLLKKDPEEYTNKEIDNFIFLPGFSTNEAVSNYSGRGVGMDVVNTNLESIGGVVDVESTPGVGTKFTLKIPLTLSIIDGMNIKLGSTLFTLPITSIRRSFKATKENLTIDPQGNEMLNIRGEVYEVVRLYEFFGIDADAKDIEEGIIILVENGEKSVCILADRLIGEHQVVVKTLPKYINKVRGLSGCTLLGNGDISLIIDVAGFFV
ncbi:MAG: chemotaxis protein CheW [Lachnospirales bacterium]